MVEPKKPAWPKTPEGNIDWEVVFEAPETGLIPRILQSRTPAILRQNTLAVITKIYARATTPKHVEEFIQELDTILPDDLDGNSMAEVSENIAVLMRRIKTERIAQVREAAQKPDLGKKARRAKTNKNNRETDSGQKKPGARARRQLLILASIGLVLLLGGGVGGWWWQQTKAATDAPTSRTLQLIDEMRAAARGEGPERHVYGWALHTKIKAGLIGITAIGIPADACASAAWVFVNRGNIIINDFMPKKVSPQVLKQACSLKGQRASLTWLQRVEDVERNQ